MKKLRLILFGGFGVTSNSGSRVNFQHKVIALLVYLAMASEKGHSRESLMGLLWPELAEADARNNLRVAVARLRGGLTKAGVDPKVIISTRKEVQFRSDGSIEVDVNQFKSLIDEAAKCKAAKRRACLVQAADLYAAPFMQGFFIDGCPAFGEWLFLERERLQLQLMALCQDLTESFKAESNYDQAIVYARRQLELDSFQESAHRQLMRIFMLRGEVAQALQQYQLCRKLLLSELGIAPSEETVQLQKQIQSGAFQQAIERNTLHAEGGDGKAAGIATENLNRPPPLPKIVTPFVGREEELALLGERLAQKQYRIISLVGSGGIGKTRLALEAGHQVQPLFNDGVYFVSLVGVQSHVDIPAVVAESIGLLLNSAGESVAEQVISFLEGRELLLIIDNLEQLIDAGGDLLLGWVKQLPNLVLLITTRERINAQEEDLFQLKGLPWPTDREDFNPLNYESVQLFGDRAQRLNKSFLLDGDTLPGIIRICQQVEGLPLALELAATLIQEYPVDKIADLLTTEPEVLETDLRDIPARHRQFDLVFDVSWRHLTEQEQQILARLSLFRDGFTKEAARQVTGSPAGTLTRLRYKSLIRAGDDGRLSMHELLRQMSERRLKTTLNIYTESEAAHAAYYFSLVIEKSPQLVTDQAAKVASEMKRELDNIRAAWQSALARLDAEQLTQVVAPLTDFYVHTGLGFEMEKLILQAEAAYEEAKKPIPIDLQMLLKLIYLDLVSSYWGSHEKIELLFQDYLERLEDWNHPLQSIYSTKAYAHYAMALRTSENLKKSAEICEHALRLAREWNDPIHLATVLCTHSVYSNRFSQLEESLSALNEAQDIFERLNHLKGMSMVADRLAPVYAENGSYWFGLVYDLKALGLYEQMGEGRRIPKGHQGAGFSCILLGAYDLARWHFNQSSLFFQRIGVKNIVDNQIGIAEIDFLEGHFERAHSNYRRSLMQYRADKDFQYFTLVAINFARSLWMSREFVEGNQIIAETLNYISQLKLTSDLMSAQIVQALLLFDQGKRDEAVAQVLELYPKLDHKKFYEPVKSYYELFHIFSRAGHPLAADVIQRAHAVVQKLAGEIEDSGIHNQFLNNVPYCKWLIEGCAQYNLPPIRQYVI